MPTYASGHLWRNYDLKMLAETAPKLVDQGYRAMKFRLGAEKTAKAELERVRVMRESVGPDIDLMIDINQGWSVDQSINIGRRLADYDIFWLEDPTNHQDYAGLARIADALDTPIAAGEYHYGLAPFRHMLEQRSIDIVMVDLMRGVGITGFMKAGHMAEAFNLPIVTHLAPEVLVHPLAALSNGLTVEWMPWSTGMFKELPKLENGELVLPDRPGLGWNSTRRPRSAGRSSPRRARLRFGHPTPRPPDQMLAKAGPRARSDFELSRRRGARPRPTKDVADGQT